MSSIDIKAKVQAIPYSQPVATVTEEQLAAEAQAAAEEAAASAPADGDLEWKGFQSPDIGVLEGVQKIANGVVSKLETIVNLLNPVLQFLELFISAFNSFSAAIESLINTAQGIVDDFSSDLANAGVFFNVLVPPALNLELFQNKEYQKLASGGYEGFLTRLQVSLNNAADPNRPIFTSGASVGGLLIMIDAESYDDFFQNINTLNNLFSFMGLLPVMDAPPPPTNLRGESGYFSDGDETKFGIRLTWDAPAIKAPLFSIGRSTDSGGTKKEDAEYIPDKLWGKDGFIRALRIRKATGKWPTRTFYEYDRIGTTAANPVSGAGAFLDTDVEEGKDYYYVVFSGFPPIYGGPSTETRVTADKSGCIPEGMVGVVQHEGGNLEFMGVGLGSLGQWSSLQLKAVLPFVPTLVEQLNKLLGTIKGMVKTGSSAFGDFLEGIQAKINKYVDLIDIVGSIIEKITNLDFGTIAMLNVPPEEGGVSHFMERVRSAEPLGDGFTGPEGITMGIVIMYGASSNVPGGADNIEANAERVKKAIGLLRTVLGIN